MPNPFVVPIYAGTREEAEEARAIVQQALADAGSSAGVGVVREQQ